MSRLVALVLTVGMLAFAGCQKDPPIYHAENEGPPPLPPASGTAIGYLVDNRGTLKLRDDQLEHLKQLDASLAARNDIIDTQLRTIERPDEQPPPAKGEPPPRHNNAPGAQIRTTGDAAKLHEARAENDREALAKAFAVLDPEQQKTAKRLLEDRGISTPGSDGKQGGDPPRQTETGVPLEP